ncbi:uncharacterized protein VICG_01700 [Vittaforma corneae ATCC 50505]|uniref:Uncharacterized protein n=1 Tax=Vittaforma corneae (strain ATCC 50505) TaxID=993615 RepID=L2GK39_VITCO|nr:uncharacterized protein VICG_01700 [Vittaforma corneae ATCC 50505]ELA41211.1 hypothetical protein VICG_01700 [Vittaforma corneae ATCC 50505]
MALAFLCIKFKKFQDFGLLLCITFLQNNFSFYFKDMSFFEIIEDSEEKNFLKTLCDKLEQYKFIVDYERFLSSNPNNQRPCQINESNTFSTEYKYHNIYIDLIHNINQGQIDKALTLSFEIFNVSTYFDSIQFMIANEKVDLLFNLSMKNVFFVKYYKEVIKKISKSLINVLEVIILTKSEVFAEGFINLLQKYTDKDKSKCTEKYSKDDLDIW